MPTPPQLQKVNPADQPILYLALSSPTLPLSTVDEYAADDPRPAHLDDQRRGAGDDLRLAEVRGARAGRSARAGRARHRHRRGRAGRRRAPTSTCRPARCTGRTRRSPSSPPASSPNAAAYRPLIVAYRNGSPVRLRGARPRHRRRAERQGRRAGSTTTARSCSPSSGSRARTPSRSSTASRKLLPVVPRSSCRPRSSSTSSTTARWRSASRSTTSVHAAPHHRPRGDGDLPLPAQRLAPRSSRASRCRCRSSAPSR